MHFLLLINYNAFLNPRLRTKVAIGKISTETKFSNRNKRNGTQENSPSFDFVKIISHFSKITSRINCSARVMNAQNSIPC